MRPREGAPATPDQVAQYGHVAAELRKALAERGWKPGDLNAAIGRDRASPAVYTYLNAKGAPAPKMRKVLSHTLNIPETALQRRHLNHVSVAEAAPMRIEGPGGAPRLAAAPPVLTFAIDDTGGMATLKLHVYRPIEEVVPLLRILLDAGAIVRGGMN